MAPLQVAFLGYPNTTGLDAIDYRLTDSSCDPPFSTDDGHSERLIRMSRGFLCFAPPTKPPLVGAPCLERGHITFGSFNNVAKISTAALDAWAEILKRIPDSRLVFKYGDRFESEFMRERIRARFVFSGVDSRRLMFLPAQSSLEQHLKTIGSVEIALDSFPYQGTMTTLETLVMGVPVITLCGQISSHRASSAILLRLGLENLVARSADEYVAIAVELAANPRQFNPLREELRAKLFASEICDVGSYTSELERTYRELWRTWCASFGPSTS